MPRRTSDISRMGSSPGLLVSDWIIRIIRTFYLHFSRAGIPRSRPDAHREGISRGGREDRDGQEAQGDQWERGAGQAQKMQPPGHKIGSNRPVICSGPTLRTRKWSAPSNKGRLDIIESGILNNKYFKGTKTIRRVGWTRSSLYTLRLKLRNFLDTLTSLQGEGRQNESLSQKY